MERDVAHLRLASAREFFTMDVTWDCPECEEEVSAQKIWPERRRTYPMCGCCEPKVTFVFKLECPKCKHKTEVTLNP